MSADAAYFLTGARRHDSLLEVLQDLETAQLGYPDELVPAQAIQLQAAVWEFLKFYGRRDERGHVDEQVTSPIQAWRPSEAQLAARAAGQLVPPDEGDESGQRDGEVADHVIGIGGTDVAVPRGQGALVRSADLGLEDDRLIAGAAREGCGLLGAFDGRGHASTVDGGGDGR